MTAIDFSPVETIRSESSLLTSPVAVTARRLSRSAAKSWSSIGDCAGPLMLVGDAVEDGRVLAGD